MYKPSDLTGPKEVNHDVMFREGQNLEVCTRLECSSWSSKRTFAEFQLANSTTC